MLGKYWVPKRENFINTIYDSFMDEAMLAGYDIVIDNMNLNKKTLKEIEDLVKEFNEWIALSPLPNLTNMKQNIRVSQILPQKLVLKETPRENLQLVKRS